jgi:SAM-dependent methyltransferase
VAAIRSLLVRAGRSPLGQWGADQACRLRDAAEQAIGRDDPMVPPTRLMFDGPRGVRAYRRNGQEFLRHFRVLGGLDPGEDVLDVGCGIGRKMLPLTTYLSPRARYEGFDINPAGVEWCARTVTPRHPNFRFQVADVHNAHYHPAGTQRAADYVFPFEDASFDFAFLGSVFTHMVPEEVDNYVGQVARVLRPGGRMLATFFLIDRDAEAAMRSGRAAYDFRFARDGHRVVDPDDPEYAVAYPEGDVLAALARHGLELRPPVHHGSWTGRADGESFQDIVVATKPR